LFAFIHTYRDADDLSK
ncbi:thiamine transporter membrane protein, partial [Haemophilus influenzae]